MASAKRWPRPAEREARWRFREAPALQPSEAMALREAPGARPAERECAMAFREALGARLDST
jgi:hypothetical protein